MLSLVGLSLSVCSKVENQAEQQKVLQCCCFFNQYIAACKLYYF